MAAELERNYTCEHCGLRAIVVLEAQAMNAMAREDDANSSVGLVRCPGCEKRPRAAMISSVARVTLWSLGAAIAFWFIGYALSPGPLGDYQTMWTLEPLILVLAAGFTIVIEIRRWEAAGRARVVRTTGPLAEKDLPKATVVARPAPRPRAPSAPPPSPVVVARELPPAVAPGEPPRFLK